jgi:hypothetical protein
MNFELLKENRSQGWASAETAPDWAKARIIEIRTAQAAKITPPAPSREYVAAAEKRFLSAATFSNRLFPGNVDAELRAQADRQAAEIRVAGILNPECVCVREVKDRHGRVLYLEPDFKRSKEILAERAEKSKLDAAEKAEELRQLHKKWFPWER